MQNEGSRGVTLEHLKINQTQTLSQQLIKLFDQMLSFEASDLSYLQHETSDFQKHLMIAVRQIAIKNLSLEKCEINCMTTVTWKHETRLIDIESK